MKNEIIVLVLMAGFAAVSGWLSAEDLEAAKVRTDRRLEDQKRYYQELLEEVNNIINEDEDTHVLEELERISRSSTKDLRALCRDLRRQSLEAQTGIDEEKETEALLRRRRWRAKVQPRRAKRKLVAIDHNSPRQAKAIAKMTDAALDEVEHLRDFKRQVDLHTQKVLGQLEKVDHQKKPEGSEQQESEERDQEETKQLGQEQDGQEGSEGPTSNNTRHDRRDRPFKWLKYLHLAISLVVVSLRIHKRLRVRWRC